MKVLSFGEILFDVIEGEYYLGGAPLNFAAHLAQCGADSYIFSKVGADEMGEKALYEIEKLGVKTTFIDVDDKFPTGTVEVKLSNGQPDYTICENVAYEFIDIGKWEKELEKINFDILYYGTLAQRNPSSRDALKKLMECKKFRHVFYDVNLRKGFYTKEILTDSLRLCTILKINDEEVKKVSILLYDQELHIEAFSQNVADSFKIEIVIITAGEKGCYVYENHKLFLVPGYTVIVADAIGAGDAFSAAFVFKYFNSEDVAASANMANKLGAYVASLRGPIPAYSPELKQSLGLELKSSNL